MKKISIVIFVLILIAIIVAITNNETPVEELMTSVEPTEVENMTSTPTDKPFEFTISGNLSDVTGGDASGFAEAGFNVENEMYLLSMIGQNLPDLEPGYFYEGWIVRRGSNMSVISTGELEMEAPGTYTNVFSTMQNLTDHDFYVLTLEPDDGDPAPADHILDGELN
jgi:hypothetical protein